MAFGERKVGFPIPGYGVGDLPAQKKTNTCGRCGGQKKVLHHRVRTGQTTREICTVLPEERKEGFPAPGYGVGDPPAQTKTYTCGRCGGQKKGLRHRVRTGPTTREFCTVPPEERKEGFPTPGCEFPPALQPTKKRKGKGGGGGGQEEINIRQALPLFSSFSPACTRRKAVGGGGGGTKNK